MCLTQQFQDAFQKLYEDLPLNRYDSLRHREKFDQQIMMLDNLIENGADIFGNRFDFFKISLFKYIYPDCKEQKEYNEELFYFLLSKEITISVSNMAYCISLCLSNREFRILEEIFKRVDDLGSLGTFDVRTNDLLDFLKGFNGVKINNLIELKSS